MLGRVAKGKKRPWARPELIVLVRSRPEEAVLAVCKHAGAANYGNAGLNSACDWNFACMSNCGEPNSS